MELFFERQERLLSSFPDLKSVIVLATAYSAGSCLDPSSSLGAGFAQHERSISSSGRVARYAMGRDYHRAIKKRMKALESFIQGFTPTEAPLRGTSLDGNVTEEAPVRFIRSIDTGPFQERVLAESAGLGFFGKNTCLIMPKGGSFIFLSALLTNLELVPDQPIPWDCGSCSLCLEACPTGALTEAYTLDARRCISYLTIELKTEIEPNLRPLLGDWLFGCDICQEVCPYNRKPLEQASWPEFEPTAGPGKRLSLQEVLKIQTEEQFLTRFAGTSLMRTKRTGLLRNACIVAGNLRDTHLIPVLTDLLENDSSALVRQQAAWALRQIDSKLLVK